MTLLKAIEKHLEATGVPPTRFGREAVGDPRLVPDLRHGRTAQPRTEAKLRAYMAVRREERR